MAQPEKTPAAAEDKKAAAAEKIITILKRVADEQFSAGSYSPFAGPTPTFDSEKSEIEGILNELCS